MTDLAILAKDLDFTDADIPVGEAFSKNSAQLRIAVTEAERTAVQVQVEKFPAVDVPQAIAFATSGNKVDPSSQQTIDTPRIKVVMGLLENLGLCQFSAQLLQPRHEFDGPVSPQGPPMQMWKIRGERLRTHALMQPPADVDDHFRNGLDIGPRRSEIDDTAA